jgi:hypothetical protein
VPWFTPGGCGAVSSYDFSISKIRLENLMNQFSLLQLGFFFLLSIGGDARIARVTKQIKQSNGLRPIGTEKVTGLGRNKQVSFQYARNYLLSYRNCLRLIARLINHRCQASLPSPLLISYHILTGPEGSNEFCKQCHRAGSFAIHKGLKRVNHYRKVPHQVSDVRSKRCVAGRRIRGAGSRAGISSVLCTTTKEQAFLRRVASTCHAFMDLLLRFIYPLGIRRKNTTSGSK